MNQTITEIAKQAGISRQIISARISKHKIKPVGSREISINSFGDSRTKRKVSVYDTQQVLEKLGG